MQKVIKADCLDKVEIHEYGTGKDCVAIIGGIHGNEYKGIEGCRALIKILDQAIQHPFLIDLLEKRKIIVVPCLNPLGNAAGARTCPNSGTMVNLSDAGKVFVESNERGGMRWPEGWADPNIGWDTNKTLAKAHLVKIINNYHPSFIVWSHDWAAPQSIVKLYHGLEPPGFDQLHHLEETLAEFYPSRTIFGNSWPFLVNATQEEDKEHMTWPLFEIHGIPSYIVEQYMYSPNGGIVHAAIALQLAFQGTGTNISEIRSKILQAAKDNAMPPSLPES